MNKLCQPQAIEHWNRQYQLNTIFPPEIMKAFELFEADAGDLLCCPGETLNQLILLVQGKLKIYRTLENGKQFLLRFNNPLGVIGDMEAFSDYEVQTFVEVVQPSQLLMVPQSAVAAHGSNNPQVLRFIIRHLSHKLYTISNASSLNLLYPLENRLASYLVSTISTDGGSRFAAEIKTSSVTEIAHLLGASYRHMNRVIRQFEMEGLVERQEGSLMVKNLEQLLLLANGNLYE
ncbi:Crp/Fnr family transcriptional regulator [Anoxynatronum buryatiense]|uniref:cAMP-binding domain of CRP or a regulatory subunit of cAMP-dependent protein kinases n=1 Tax=Anoxynatronum buryatiense TaxID=489973 RepID=A0AA45WVW3_9CLOT|nr:cyclic nucleotide-binding domain-containing protein [Anoxynatronum buryatiense]SMP56127.1 cAMP-binding domain of CRP or a regulatory subunit of cAMP-dependent protein kinases [Anoxynatronum buryatiense]